MTTSGDKAFANIVENGVHPKRVNFKTKLALAEKLHKLIRYVIGKTIILIVYWFIWGILFCFKHSHKSKM